MLLIIIFFLFIIALYRMLGTSNMHYCPESLQEAHKAGIFIYFTYEKKNWHLEKAQVRSKVVLIKKENKTVIKT